MGTPLGKRKDVGFLQMPLPVAQYPNGLPMDKYESEKKLGIRTPGGHTKLKRLTSRHLRIITMHVAGISTKEIAKHMSVYPGTVLRILQDPLAKSLIEQAYTGRQMEINALTGKAVDAVREALDNQDDRVKMSAVDRFVKLKDAINPEKGSEETAEDVIARVLNAIQINGENVQVNFGGKDRGDRALSSDD